MDNADTMDNDDSRPLIIISLLPEKKSVILQGKKSSIKKVYQNNMRHHLMINKKPTNALTW
jgi:hypothetical protein